MSRWVVDVILNKEMRVKNRWGFRTQTKKCPWMDVNLRLF
jgi:hypothetical protein